MNRTHALIALTGTTVQTVAQTADTHPNIVLLMVDDMGWQDTSLPFWIQKTPLNRRYHTPNMERLASQRMIFTQVYACSVSSPMRVSLLTGMNAALHRVTNRTLEKNTTTDGKPSPLQAVPELKDYWGKDIFVTEALTQEAMKTLDKAKCLGQPFFLDNVENRASSLLKEASESDTFAGIPSLVQDNKKKSEDVAKRNT